MSESYTLVTGATGLIGAHVVDILLQRGHRVRAVARSKAKAETFIANRTQYKDKLDIFYINDLTDPGAFDDAVKDITGVVHVASPFDYSQKDNEKVLIIPAIKGVQSILQASSISPSIKRIVLTSSFAAVLNMSHLESEPRQYTNTDWNPTTYAESASPTATPQDAYRGSKTFAERAAWDFMKDRKPTFDLVTLCPSMIFGPLADPPKSVGDLNESDRLLLKVLTGKEGDDLPPCRFNFWMDVRDLAELHVRALETEECGGKRYVPVAPEGFTYQMAAEVVGRKDEFDEGKGGKGGQKVKEHLSVERGHLEKDFPGMKYRGFKEMVGDFWGQVKGFV